MEWTQNSAHGRTVPHKENKGLIIDAEKLTTGRELCTQPQAKALGNCDYNGTSLEQDLVI